MNLGTLKRYADQLQSYCREIRPALFPRTNRPALFSVAMRTPLGEVELIRLSRADASRLHAELGSLLQSTPVED